MSTLNILELCLANTTAVLAPHPNLPLLLTRCRHALVCHPRRSTHPRAQTQQSRLSSAYPSSPATCWR
jgi:hypothetical protein